jgi:hypothetical protein
LKRIILATRQRTRRLVGRVGGAEGAAGSAKV